jgi:festuclavine dehydrogenase
VVYGFVIPFFHIRSPHLVGFANSFFRAENLVEPGLVYTIGQLNSIFTATQDGKIPFISADDIADVAYHALTDDKAPNCDLRILGPELLTYDQVR